MASSGSFGNTFRNGYRIQIDWKITGTNVANNTSTVEATFYLISLGSAFTINSSTNKTVRLRIAGQTYSTSANVSLSGNQKKPLFTKRVTVSHNADGTKNITLGGNINLNVTLSGKYWSNVAISDKTFTLNTIPRSSTISSFPNFTIGNSFSVSISRASSSFTHKLVLYLGNTYIGEWSGIGTSTTVTPNSTHQDRLYKAMPNSSSATVTLRCYTYSGSTQIGGYKTKTATVTVPSSIVPSFTSISHSEAVGNINTIVGSYVQGLSKLKIDILGATGAKYSTIRSYQITFDGTTYNANNVITNFIKGSGSLTITAKVIDSRGRSATKSTIINVLSYSPPKITKFIIYRSNSSNARDENSSNVRVELNSSFNLLNNKNSATVSIKSKLRGESTWTTKYSTTNTTGNISYANLLSGYDSLRAYDFMIEVKDKFNTALSLGVISAGIIPMSLGVTGIGVGKVWEKGSLDVKGDSYFDGDVHIDGNFSLNSTKIPYLNPATVEEFNELVDRYDANIPNGSFYKFSENPKINLGGIFGGSTWLIEGFKGNPDWGWQRGATYSSNGMKIATRAKYNGAWTSWNETSPTFGSNANGKYLKYPNGVLICWVRNFPLTQQYAANYYKFDNWVFPAKFNIHPTVIPVGYGHYDTRKNASSSVGYGTTTVSSTKIYSWLQSGTYSTDGRKKLVNIVAIGTWK